MDASLIALIDHILEDIPVVCSEVSVHYQSSSAEALGHLETLLIEVRAGVMREIVPTAAHHEDLKNLTASLQQSLPVWSFIVRLRELAKELRMEAPIS